ncbi:TPA: hypothetical protein N0F65_008563 [Lagenidium giganteum]|uniref:Nucleolar complex protein 3 homolog n=1 Tax=Lagenidium giganteum TaxID=4803 RepID=A0AAV2YKF3_9STRA|nr:TPA: hypothetical protein N0F65_008563 [Lagenidium giganteum]
MAKRKQSGGAAKNTKKAKKNDVNGNKSNAKNVKKPTKKGSNKAGKKQQPVADVEEEVDVEDDDIEFFEENEQYSSFLMHMDANKMTKPEHLRTKQQRPVEAKKEKDLEEMENMPRKPQWEKKKKDLSTKLPVKFMDGSVRPNKLMAEDDTPQPQEEEKEEEEGDDNEEEEDEEEEADEVADMDEDDVSDMEFEEIQDTPAVEEKPVSEVDLRLQREHRVAAKKVEIAQLCESILENPEEALKKSKEHPEGLSKVQQLHALCQDQDTTIRKLSMLSELTVFLDILPDYRIRLQQEAEGGKGRPLKKKVQQMQDYEASMLSNYQKFLKFCSQVVTDGLKGKRPTDDLSPRDRVDISLAETGAKCLTELLKVKYAFNFHLNLIMALVPLADSHFPSIRTVACEAFVTVFKADKSCMSSYEIVKQISAYVRKKEHRVKEDIIRTLVSMPLEVTMEAGEEARKKAKWDRKRRRKQQQEGDTIASGLKEAEAVVDKSEREKTQADILHEIVLIYFRILKQATYSTALPAVLAGLSKFAFLINLDIMIDLLKVLKTILKEDILPLPSALHAVLTGLRTLQGPGQELMVDEKDFVDILYRLLRKFSEGEDVSCFPTALQCVEAVFLKRKELVVDRVAAFIKRLLLISIHLQPHHILAVLSLMRSLFHRYSKLHQLLESDLDRVASGEYRADVDDPDFTNPYSTALWELTLLERHYHPVVSSFALGTAELGPSLPTEYPRSMLENYNTTLTGAFIPKVPVPPKNPLYTKIATDRKKQANKRRQRVRNFFVRDPLTEKSPSPFFQMCQEVDNAPTEQLSFRK